MKSVVVLCMLTLVFATAVNCEDEVKCTTDEECSTGGMKCNPYLGVCSMNCKTDGECPTEDMVCHPYKHFCLNPCYRPEDCADDGSMTCLSTGECSSKCTTDEDCPADEGLKCNPLTDFCSQKCKKKEDLICTSRQMYCDTKHKVCFLPNYLRSKRSVASSPVNRE